MRSLGSIRARVERLASDWLPPPETVFIGWVLSHERSPSCGANLKPHAQAAALARAVERRDPRDLPPPWVWVDDLLTCPLCGATLPA